MAQQPQGGQGGKGGSGGDRQNPGRNPATDPAQRSDPDAANTDETVQAEERAAGGTSGGTSGSGNTRGGAENVEERKVIQQGEDDQDDQNGQNDNKGDKGQQGPVKIAVAGDEHGDEDATSQ